MGWGVEGSRLEAWIKSHKSEVAITTRKQCLCWKRHRQIKHLEHESKYSLNCNYIINTVTM